MIEENNESNVLPENKKTKLPEALQELLRIRPDLKGKSVYFFYKNNKFIGVLIYDKGENMSYVYDPASGNKENRLNNYLCSGSWFVYFQQEFQLLQFPHSVQRIVAFLILQKVISETFKGNNSKNDELEKGGPNLLPQVIINLDLAEASKFVYIVG